MLRHPTPTHPRLRRWYVWLLLMILPVQGMSSILLQVLGPAHVHQSTRVAASLRSAPLPSSLAQPLYQDGVVIPMLDIVSGDGTVRFSSRQLGQRTASAHQAAHDNAHPQRHHHAADDATVVFTDDADLSASLTDDEGTGGTPGFMPMPVGAAAWPLASTHLGHLMARDSAPWTTWYAAPAERPPRTRLG